jgi:hypothetical protein
MRLKNVKGSREKVASSTFIIQEPEGKKVVGKCFLEMKIQYILK